MNLVPSIPTSPSVPTYLPPMTDRALRTCVTRLVPPISVGQTRYSIAVGDAPSEALRQALAKRCDRIDNWLQPAGPEAATEAYKDLLANMSAASLDQEGEIREMRGFVEATSKLPLFALTAACTAFREGSIGDGKWMPKAGQVCIEAQRRVALFAKERREIEAVLSAVVKEPVPDADFKARNLADARAFVAHSRSMDEALQRPAISAEKVAEDKAVTEAVAAGHPDPRPPVTMGPDLQRVLQAQGALRPPPPAPPIEDVA